MTGGRKREKKLWPAVILISALALCCFLTSGIAEGGDCGEHAGWQFDGDGTLYITGYGPMKNYANYSFQPWNDFRAQIRRIVVGEEITHIGSHAFANLPNLISVSDTDLPLYLDTIGASAFRNCGKHVRLLPGP